LLGIAEAIWVEGAKTLIFSSAGLASLMPDAPVARNYDLRIPFRFFALPPISVSTGKEL